MAITKVPPSPRSVVQHKTIVDLSHGEAIPLDKEVPCNLEDCATVTPTRQRQCRRPSSVTINEDANVEHINTSWTKEDITTNSCWYTKADYRQFKTNYRELSTQISQREAVMMTRNAASWANVMLRLYDACSDDDENDEKQVDSVTKQSSFPLSAADYDILIQRTLQSHGRLGCLDCVPNLSHERAWRRRQVVLAATRMSPRLVTPSTAGCNVVCAALSRPSVRMAHHLATVLEASLQRESF